MKFDYRLLKKIGSRSGRADYMTSYADNDHAACWDLLVCRDQLIQAACPLLVINLVLNFLGHL